MQCQTYKLKNPTNGRTVTLKNMPGWMAYQIRQEAYRGWVFV
ncbi:MAG: hypothetical protein AAFX78_05025 [Cyanobacteria bacterium J06638_20]